MTKGDCAPVDLLSRLVDNPLGILSETIIASEQVSGEPGQAPLRLWLERRGLHGEFARQLDRLTAIFEVEQYRGVILRSLRDSLDAEPTSDDVFSGVLALISLGRDAVGSALSRPDITVEGLDISCGDGLWEFVSSGSASFSTISARECDRTWFEIRIDERWPFPSMDLWQILLEWVSFRIDHEPKNSKDNLDEWRIRRGVRSLIVWVDYADLRSPEPVPTISTSNGNFELHIRRRVDRLAHVSIDSLNGEAQEILDLAVTAVEESESD